MKILFIHNNAPAQFRHIAQRLARDPRHEVVFLSHPGRPDLPGVRAQHHRPDPPAAQGHPWLQLQEKAALNAHSAALAAMVLREGGFVPDVMVGHPGWGETLLLKEVFPKARLIQYCEFYYSNSGADIGFDPEDPPGPDQTFRTPFRNAHLLMGLEAGDEFYSPTEWQRSRHPAPWRDRIEVIHDGIDCAVARPDPAASLRLQSGVTLRTGDPVVTYVARNLEPYRGFHSFMRALPHLLERRPDARVMIVGGSGVSYGRNPPAGETYRSLLMRETGLNSDRVHFLGKIPYAQFIALMQVSAAHVYLTYPFVLSWSCLEAMAAGALIVGSDTAPVREVIKDGQNGLLVDFFDPRALAAQVATALDHAADMAPLRQHARQTVLERFELESCLSRLTALIEG